MSITKEEISLERIDDFLVYLEEKGRGKSSLQSYRRKLLKLYRYLPEEKYIDENTGPKWKEYMKKQGLQPVTINTSMSIWNSFLQYLGHREWQMTDFDRESENVQPELSRTEYLRLLSVAKHLGKEKSYLLFMEKGRLTSHTYVRAGQFLQESISCQALPSLWCPGYYSPSWR